MEKGREEEEKAEKEEQGRKGAGRGMHLNSSNMMQVPGGWHHPCQWLQLWTPPAELIVEVNKA